MRWLLRLLSALLLPLALISPAVTAAADGSSPGSAIPLAGTVSGGLTGDSAGAFVYYTFNYPGDGSQGTVTLTFSPSDPITANGVGVNLYQGTSQLATLSGVGSTPGTNSQTFSSTVNAPVLVQVFNYDQGVPISFQLNLAGVNPLVAGAVATPVPASSPTITPIALTSPQSGTLAGNPAGSYAYYTFDYPGDGSTQSVTLSFTPTEPDVANAVAIALFQNGSQLISDNASHASVPGQFSVSFSSTVAGPIIVQLGNYHPTTGISYTISH